MEAILACVKVCIRIVTSPNGFNGQLLGHNTDQPEWPAKITPVKCDGNDTISTFWGDASFSIYCGMTICCDSSGPKTDISNHCHSCWIVELFLHLIIAIGFIVKNKVNKTILKTLLKIFFQTGTTKVSQKFFRSDNFPRIWIHSVQILISNLVFFSSPQCYPETFAFLYSYRFYSKICRISLKIHTFSANVKCKSKIKF